MVVSERISEDTYRGIALGDGDRVWELHDGQLVEKPGMSWEHGDLNARLSYLLQHQLKWDEFRVRINEGRLRRSPETYVVPDIVVVPAAFARLFADQPGTLPIFPDQLPLVVEVWSPSTGGYDVAIKLPLYRERGDNEIWFLHPYERTLTTWVRQPDGSYEEAMHRDGVVRPVYLPGVAIRLEDVFRP